MHFYSFDLNDPIFDLGGFRLSLQVITLENVYGLDPSGISTADNGQVWRMQCIGLRWAGGQQTAPGQIELTARREGPDRLRLSVRATAPHKIRAIKIILRDLSELQVLDPLDAPQAVPADGIIERYPNKLRLPLLLASDGAGTLGARCEDPQARAKRFALYAERMGALAGCWAMELIHEEDARHFDTTLAAPDWIVARGVTPDAFRAEQLAYSESTLGLVPWEQRTDVPDWARDLRLCLTLHGMHWSGYVFNTYDDMRRIIDFVCERMDGRHVLAYLPGWEGRYYWQYGDFRPEPLLGGEDGFARLCDAAAARGVHVMPMFGGNCANAWDPNFHTFGPSSYMKSPTRNVFHGNQPDWDLSRAHDTGWQAWLNPGAPAWQRELSEQILGLIARHGFDGVFLDTVEVWTNDPDFNLREGYRQLVNRLRADHPDLLVAGEDWWDGLLGIFPLFQRSGPWRQVPEWVGRYARLFGHICEGDPNRGSTGVFESGCATYVPLPDRVPYLATIAFVDGTLEGSRAELERVVNTVRAR
ncbi:MAG TPA: endo alpha-1,4 polygalactosaminidase [Aggregatilinea sp.]|uniref:endo alpha-1,4 polygalactosaminidase n=1 Tax=Aggregatilinea sp. TaxID=2806333 RepID=UPI002B838CB2|nr:endo alpha-1,4 polygalactosaminidase [Aggregatilinea sp.]HML20646.1 endo alpha-1,4 polygalactosaminidase [Aggregatilinea sp.]